MQAVRQSRQDNRHLWNAYYEELRDYTQEQLERLIGGVTKDKKVIPSSDPTAPVLKLLIARSLLYAMRTGRAFELQTHREMMCGPEPKLVELSGRDGQPLSPLSKYTPEQLASLYAAADKIIKESECSSTPTSSSPSLPPSSQPSSGTPS